MLSKKEIIDIFIRKHGDRYDYSKVNFKGQCIKVEIICNKHGSFFQTPSNHKRGQNCPLCSIKRRKDFNYFLEHALKRHGGKYDYSTISYKNITDFYIIYCPIHGNFKQRGSEHLKFGCNECAKIQRPISSNQGLEKFIEKSKKTHGDRYNYSKVKYIKSSEKVEILCNKHGSFFQQPQSHVLGVGCPKCKMSRGEFIMGEFLKENNIEFIYNFYSKECKQKTSRTGMYFDFYIPFYKTFIEVDGSQHYYKTKYWDKYESLENRQIRDEIKNRWSLNNGYNIIRINPNKFKKYKNLLLEEMKNNKNKLIKLL